MNFGVMQRFHYNSPSCKASGSMMKGFVVILQHFIQLFKGLHGHSPFCSGESDWVQRLKVP